ncbi:MAG: arylsulfatase [Isosphaeraceae bacterium]|nr:arylsulfatase [Isosphaeraceae bacterium]
MRLVRRFVGWLVVILVGSAGSILAAPERKPNVVVILADDQGWGDLGIHGNANLSTPRIDALAKAGARFERFFVCPVCAPTRAEFLTGRYHLRGGVRGVSTGFERLDLGERTLAESLLAAGYETGAFGKWHNGSQWPYHPNARGFREFFGFTSGHWGEYFDAPLEHNGRFVKSRGFIADAFTDRAIEFIGENASRPFFCYLAFNTPHSPFSVPDKNWDAVKDRSIGMRGPEGAKEDLAVTRAALGLCENLDANVGRVLDELDRRGLADDTIVVYFSDNGPNSARWNGGMRGRKGSTDEGGVRSPCFISWPGRIAAGRVVPEIAGAIDLLPTLLALAGAKRVGDRPLDGRDLSPLLLGKPVEWTDRMIFTHQNGQVSVRTRAHRLDATGRLYDMVADPGQTKDLAKAERETADRLKLAVDTWKRELNPSEPVGARRVPQNLSVDARPVPVGFPEFPTTVLPARDGAPSGGIGRSASAPNCSYFVNWTTTEGRITWNIEVETAGEYDVVAWYTCPEADAGARIELAHGSSRLEAKIDRAWDPPLLADQDRVERKGESIMKEFRPIVLGRIRLERGRGPLILRAIEIPGKSVMDLRMITLTLR